jgi:hypothetical protein
MVIHERIALFGHECNKMNEEPTLGFTIVLSSAEEARFGVGGESTGHCLTQTDVKVSLARVM